MKRRSVKIYAKSSENIKKKTDILHTISVFRYSDKTIMLDVENFGKVTFLIGLANAIHSLVG